MCDEPLRSGEVWVAFRAETADGAGAPLVGVLVSAERIDEPVMLSDPSMERVRDAEWSFDGTHLAYVSGPDEAPATHVLRMDCREPFEVVVVAGERPRWSADGWLALSSAARTELWVLHPERAHAPVRVDGGILTAVATFAPTGSHLVLEAREGPGLFLVDASAPAAPQSLWSGRADFVTWSPLGDQLAFSSDDDRYYLADLRGVATVRDVSPPHSGPSPFPGYLHRWSDDGRWLGYKISTAPSLKQVLLVGRDAAELPAVVNPAPWPEAEVYDWELVPGGGAVIIQQAVDAPPKGDLFLVDLEGDSPPRRLNEPILPHEDVFPAAWASGGTELLFRSDRAVDQAFELYRVAVAGAASAPERISRSLPSDQHVEAVSVAPSGARLCYTTHTGTSSPHVGELVYVDLSGRTAHAAPPLPSNHVLGPIAAGNPWHPQSSAFVYSNRDGDVVLQRVDGAELGEAHVLWEPYDEDLRWLAWQPR
jgi:dipeptidyl aminopeptidase/acylaminoacyl peptidase